MFKNIPKLLITFLLLSLLITSNTSAFHKENSKTKRIDTEWNGDSTTKKNFETKSKEEWCALKATPDKVTGEPKIDQNTGLQTTDDNGKKLFDEDKFKVKLKGYHDREPEKTNGKLLPTLPKLNFSANWEKLKLVELLKMYCLQDIKKLRPEKFKGSYLEELYKQIAADNGFTKINKEGKEVGDYSKNILEGPLLDDIFKPENGIIIKDPNVVWYVPDFLIDAYRKNKIDDADALAKKKAAEVKLKKKKARDDAINTGNEKWISENKKDYLEQFVVKLNDYKKIIQGLTDDRKKLNQYFKELKNKIEEANEEIEIAFDDLANINQEIKGRKKEIRENKKTYLSKVTIESFEGRLKEINSINFEKYENYVELKKIIKKAKKSNSAKDFVGKDGYQIKWPKILGGGSHEITSEKLGLIEKFEDIKKNQTLLGPGYKTHSSNIRKLDKEIKIIKKSIDVTILKLVQELVAYDNELEEEKAKTPWETYAIYLVIFLVVVAVILYLILNQRKMKKDLEEGAEQKVGSLKSDLEGKLKHTSEQIRSVRTSSPRQSQSQSEAQPVLEEAPKTSEQIIADKYDELISDYNDALDDFSKVAEFKQKWNGLALSRKERQDGTKTVLISTSRAFEKAGIWCVSFSDKYFGLPGLSIKSNMATYMNMNFMKADQDFKGIFSISEGSSYSTEPCVLRKGGAVFVVERNGKITFPN